MTKAKSAKTLVDIWEAQRLALVKHRNAIAEDIRLLDEMIGAFGESEDGAQR